MGNFSRRRTDAHTENVNAENRQGDGMTAASNEGPTPPTALEAVAKPSINRSPGARRKDSALLNVLLQHRGQPRGEIHVS